MDETILLPSPNWFQSSAMAVSTDGWLLYSGPSKSICVLEPLPQDNNLIVKGQPAYTAHVLNRAHPEKIACVDISPEWPEKRSFLSGSVDGAVKQWSLEKNDNTLKIRSTHSHEIHRQEEVIGVGYCKDGYAVTVGGFGNIVKWDLNSNVAKTFNHVLKNFKPTCMACSPHLHMNVAIGTKQGVLLVLDLNGAPRIIYKVRGQDNEILKVSWCPQYEVAVRKALKDFDRRSTVTQRMENLRQQATSPESMKKLEEKVKNSQTTERPIKINEKSEPVVEDSAARATEQKDKSGIDKTLPEDKQIDESGIGKTLPEDKLIDESGIDKTLPEDKQIDKSDIGKTLPEDKQIDESGIGGILPEDKQIDESKIGKTLPKDIQLEEAGIGKTLPEDKQIDEFGIGKTLPEDRQIDESGTGKTLPEDKQMNESGIVKSLPEDSFDSEETIVQEDDTFDIYKDHEADEFGHKKYQPVDIFVKVPKENTQKDYLSECEKLKEEILKRKAQLEAPISTLVDAMEKVQVGKTPEEEASTSKIETVEKSDEQPSTSKYEPPVEGRITKGEVESSVHIHKHLLATVGKTGSIRVWSKAGKLVGSCVVPCGIQPPSKAGRGDKRVTVSGYFTLVWCKPDSLLIADGKNQLLECNPLKIDCKNKLEWKVLHTLHKRGLFVVVSSAPRVQTPEQAAAARSLECEVWSASQDRSLVRYCLNSGRVNLYATCGGFLYMMQTCPYDARKLAVAVGDGAVRVWVSEDVEEGGEGGQGEGFGVGAGHVGVFWQNVQGKVLSVAWHPAREGLLAFATAEARVGLLDTSMRGERPARVLQPACAYAVYSLCWGEGMQLYAAGAGELLLYDATQHDKLPTSLPIGLQGAAWEVSSVVWEPALGGGGRLVVGNTSGAVGVCGPAPDYTMLAAAFLYKKMIHMTQCHPPETSSASEPSPYSRLMAVCSLDKNCNIALLEYDPQGGEAGSASLTVWKWLSGHSGPVLQVAWSPHHDQLLLSTSQDSTVRVWDVSAGCCVSIFGRHTQTALGVAWSPHPSLPDIVLSGGGDCALRMWDHTRYPADMYHEIKHEVSVGVVEKKKKTKKNNKDKKKRDEEEQDGDEEEGREREASEGTDLDEQAVSALAIKRKYNKKFLLPMIFKQTHPCPVRGVRKLLEKYLQQNGMPVPWPPTEEPQYGMDFIKLFGTINEVNEVLDDEASRLLDTGSFESWVVLCIVRGYIDTCIQWAAAKNLLDPFLVSIAPGVSFKYWKDVTQLYLQQLDRLFAKGEEFKLNESRGYGGAVYRRTAVLLGLHDLRGAVDTLHQARLYKEAYVLSRTRYMESYAEESLRLWANITVASGDHNMAAACYIALGDLSQAAAVLGRSENEESLRLGADIATVLGQTTFAGHIQRHCHLLQNQRVRDAPDPLPPLPPRVQILLERATDDDSDDDVAGSVSDSSSTLKDSEPTNEFTATDELTGAENRDEDKVHDKDEKVDIAKAEEKQDLISEDVEIAHLISEVSKVAQSLIAEAEQESNSKAAAVAHEVEYDVAQRANMTENDTKELLERLPGMMTTLMKESRQDVPISLGTHRGDGDSNINAENITVKASQLDPELQVNGANVE